MNNSNNLDYFTLYIIFSIAFMLITLLVILIAKPSTGLGEVLVTINLLNGFAPIFPDTCYHLTHYWPAAAD
ncbi:hypothetical protein, partial [Escherichia coli]|uniref:hypothetical protein n=3 Tax=Escherichia coli TaxID=562 RepID=UPI00098C0DB0